MFRAALAAARRIGGARDANVSAVIALMLVPIIGALGMGAEGGTFYLAQRAMQNVADAAVLAAANNGCASTDACHTTSLMPTYDVEARAVASRMGFPNGGDISVTSSNSATCPGGGSGCYTVTVTKKVPFYLLKVVGFPGDTTNAAGVSAVTVKAGAMAQLVSGNGYCITALGSGTRNNSAIQFAGSNALNLTGCDLYAPNGAASCNAHTGDTIRYAYVGSSNNNGKDCGTQRVVSSTFTNNFASLSSSVPANPCGGNYPQSGGNRNQDHVTTPANRLSAEADITSTPKCGDVVLNNDITVTGSRVLTIYNGRFDLAGHKLQTTTGSLTIILTGTTLNSGPTVDSIITSTSNGATLDMAAPTSGTWSGIAVYQTANLTGSSNNTSMTFNGNNPQMDMTGLFYAPLATISVSGAINHATAGQACLAFLVNQFDMSGTGSLFAWPTLHCNQAGLAGLATVSDKAVLVM